MAGLLSLLSAPTLITSTVAAQGADAAYVLGTVIGVVGASSTLIIGLIWAVLYFTYVQHRAPQRGATYLIAIAATVLTFELAIVLLGPAMSNDDEAQAKIALQDFSNALDTIAAADLAHPPTIDTKPKATGQVGVLEGVVMTYLATVLDDRIKYQAELKEAGAGAFLKPSTLAADPGLRHAQQTVTRLHSIVAKYRGLSDARLAQVRDAIARSSLNDRLKAQFNIGVARSSAQNDEARHRLWDMEAKLVDDYGQIVQGLAHPHGRWIASGNAIRFSNNQDLSEYNARIADVRDLVQQQRQLQAGAMARTRALLKTQQDSFN